MSLLFNMEAPEPTEIDRQIAKHLIPHIVDGATLQLGIGSMPNALGEIIAKSDLKDLGDGIRNFVPMHICKCIWREN